MDLAVIQSAILGIKDMKKSEKMHKSEKNKTELSYFYQSF